ncbi:MAG: penicillin-binding transpeptidase domain-containing protein, partial [bacterium]
AVLKPLLVSEVKNPENKSIKKYNTKINNLSIAKNTETSREVINMLRGVVKEGTGSEANINGIDIIGKTGTAQKLSKNGNYEEGHVNTTFFGIVKFLKDPIIILVVIYDPIEKKWASETAAPLFKNIVSDIIDYGLIFEY